MKISVNIDSVGFTAKPAADAVGAIRNRLCAKQSVCEVTIAQLATAIESGRTWTPGVMYGTTAATWQSQQVICADVDNDKHGQKTRLDSPLQPQEALDVLAVYGITPTMLYYTFSSRTDWPRYRVVIILDHPITDAATAKEITARLAAALNATREGCTDTTIADGARLLYGTTKGGVFYRTENTTSIETLMKLPPADTQTRPAPQQVKTNWQMTSDNEKRIMSALKAIPCASTTRAEWVGVGMAVKSLGWPFEVWDDWSRTDPARYDERTVIRTWRSFRESGTINHSFIAHLALDYGWTAPTTKHKEGEKVDPMDNKNTTAAGQKTEIKQAVAQTEMNTATETPALVSPVVLMLQSFETDKFKPVSTGEYHLDEILGGGFFRGTLNVLGAAPGLGKTTLCTQLLENMAARGVADVVYFNLEMSREQLFARSLSRTTGFDAMRIMQGYKWTDEQQKAIKQAAFNYEATTAKHIVYNPRLQKPSNKDEENTADYNTIYKTMVQIAKRRSEESIPLICCIDYLQILQGEKGMDDVSIIKCALQSFKEFAITYNAIILLIVAHSRAINQMGKATLGAGRDSSAVEYSGDTQMSLNYTAMIEKKKLKSGKARNYSTVDELLDAIENGEEQVYSLSDLSLTVTKSRFTPANGRCDMKLDGGKSRFVFNKHFMPQSKKAL